MKLRPSLLAGAALAVLALAPGSFRALAQANGNPPERLTYQGFLVDGDGDALGNPTPKNYDVIFRIYNHETAGAEANLSWGEQQTVTVDKGYFSVILGEGAPLNGVSHLGLSTLFRGPDASDRYVGITVKGLGAGGADVDILPRLRLLSSPYAFLAQNAVKLVQNTGADLITSAGNVVSVSGGLSVVGNNVFELGAGIAGKDVSAGKIGYSIFTPGALDIVGAGTLGSNRRVKIWGEGGTTFSGPVSATGFSGDGSTLSGVAKLGGGNTFSGGQVFNNNLGIGTTGLNYPLNFASVVGDKISLWGQDANHYGFGIQGGRLQIHTDGAGSAVAFGYGNSAAMTETMRIEGSGRLVVQGGVLARGGYPGGGGGANNGYAFSGNGGDNDSGMFSETDGHLRFTSNSELKFSVYPSGAYVHNGGLTVDSYNGTTFKVTGNVIQVFEADNKAKYLQMWRYANGVAIQGFGGGWGNASGDFRQITWDGDGNWDAASDRRLKRDIVDAEPVLERALKVQVRRYRWKDDPADAKLALGVVAQELQPLFPDLIAEQEDPATKEKHLAVGYSDFGLIAVKAIQELHARQEAELSDLKQEMADMKAQMAELMRINGQLMNQVQKASTTTASVR
jgi:hypothetical protein